MFQSVLQVHYTVFGCGIDEINYYFTVIAFVSPCHALSLYHTQDVTDYAEYNSTPLVIYRRCMYVCMYVCM